MAAAGTIIVNRIKHLRGWAVPVLKHRTSESLRETCLQPACLDPAIRSDTTRADERHEKAIDVTEQALEQLAAGNDRDADARS